MTRLSTIASGYLRLPAGKGVREVSEPEDICVCNHSRLNHDPVSGCGWDDCQCREFVLRSDAPDLIAAIKQNPKSGSYVPEITFTQRDLDLAVLEARIEECRDRRPHQAGCAALLTSRAKPEDCDAWCGKYFRLVYLQKQKAEHV